MKIFTEIWGDLWNAAVSIVKDLWDLGSKLAGKIWDNIKEGWAKISEGASAIGTKLWEGLKTGLDSLGTLFSDLGTDIWEGLKKGLEGLGSIFTKLFDSLNLGSLVDKLFPKQKESQGFVERKLSKAFNTTFDIPVLNFAEGTSSVPGNAVVPGDSKLNDRIVAMLSPDEAVIPRSKMKDPYIKNLVERILSGDITPPGFAGGLSMNTLKDRMKIKAPEIKVPTFPDMKDISVENLIEAAKKLNPSNILNFWEQFKEKAKSKAMEAAGRLVSEVSFDKGGRVSNDGMATLHKDEIVLARPLADELGGLLKTRMAKDQQGSITIEQVNFNIESNDTVDEDMVRERLWPEFKELLRRESLDGKRLIEITGVG